MYEAERYTDLEKQVYKEKERNVRCFLPLIVTE